MNSKFVDHGLQEDRYLKAIKLIERFETEIERQLKHTVKEIVSENPELFSRDSDDSKLDHSARRFYASVMAYAITNYPMNRYASDEQDADRLKLSLMIHWDEPSALGHDGGDGSLAVTSLRIKNASDADHQKVKQRTQEDDWPSIHFGDDPWDTTPGLFYIPVETAEDLECAHKTLRDHFGEYGAEYGVPQDNSASDENSL